MPGADFADFKEIEAEGLDLGEDAEERGSVRQQASKHGFGTLLLWHEGRERCQQGRAEVAADPDLVQHRVITHGSIFGTSQVSRHHRD